MKSDVTINRVETDLLILGDGSACLWAAHRFSELMPGRKVCIVDKSPQDWGGLMTMAGGDFEAVQAPDTEDEWLTDLVYYFDGLCDQPLMEALLSRSADRMRDYERFGCEFSTPRTADSRAYRSAGSRMSSSTPRSRRAAAANSWPRASWPGSRMPASRARAASCSRTIS